MKIKQHILFITCFGVALFSEAQTGILSIADIKENPEMYQGKVVTVIGDFELHFEGDTICSDVSLGNCLRIILDDEEQYKELNGTSVAVIAEFQQEDLDYDFVVERGDDSMTLQFGPYMHTLINVELLVDAKNY